MFARGRAGGDTIAEVRSKGSAGEDLAHLLPDVCGVVIEEQNVLGGARVAVLEISLQSVQPILQLVHCTPAGRLQRGCDRSPGPGQSPEFEHFPEGRRRKQVLALQIDQVFVSNLGEKQDSVSTALFKNLGPAHIWAVAAMQYMSVDGWAERAKQPDRWHLWPAVGAQARWDPGE